MPTSPRLDAAYVAQVKQVRARVQAFALGRFAAGEYRDADLKRFVSQVVPVVLAGRRSVSALTDAYLSRKLGVPAKGPIDTSLLRGVEPAEIYARPFVTVRTKLSDGLPFDAAVNAGTARLVDLTATDMQLAKTTTSREVYQGAGIERFVRTLSGGNSCALCYLASTQTYSTDDLMPIHPGCDCGTEPVESGFREVADANLSATHEAISDRFGKADSSGRDIGLGDAKKDYSKVVIVRNHGEIGPVLAVKGDHFSGPSVVNN